MTGSTLSPAERGALERAFTIGLGRQTLPAPGLIAGQAEEAAMALDCLGLLAQRRRYDRPGPIPPAPPAARVLREDGRPLLDAEDGRLLQRFVEACSMRGAAPLLEAMVARMAASGLRPHPFQVRRMTAILKKQGCSFRQAEEAYLAEVDPVTVRAEPGLETVIDSGNWMELPRQRRVDYIAALRLSDPPAARALVESCVAAEPANVRADLVGALAAGLSTADRAFLEGLAGDRAPSVRDAAARLLSLIPGTTAHGERLARATAALRAADGCVMPVDPSASAAQLHALFEGLSVEELAERFAVSATGFIPMVAPASEPLLLALARSAARTRRVDILAAVIAAASSSGRGWARVTGLLATDLPGIDGESRARLVAALAPFGSDPFPRAVAWRALAVLCGGALPADLAEPIIRSAGWQSLMESLQDDKAPRRIEADADIAAFAAVLPTQALPDLVDALAAAPPGIAAFVGPYAAFVAALEKRAAPGADH